MVMGVLGENLSYDPTGFDESSPMLFDALAGMVVLAFQTPKEILERVDSIKESMPCTACRKSHLQ
jgi:hypothetical protein